MSRGREGRWSRDGGGGRGCRDGGSHADLIRYHGVLAPNQAWRRGIVLRKPPEEELSEGAAKPAGPAKGTSWAELLRRVFALEVLVCRFCGGERRIIAEVEEGPMARKISPILACRPQRPSPPRVSSSRPDHRPWIA